jgi:hypothetical protein
VREPIPEPPPMHQQDQGDWPPDEEGDWFVVEVMIARWIPNCCFVHFLLSVSMCVHVCMCFMCVCKLCGIENTCMDKAEQKASDPDE